MGLVSIEKMLNRIKCVKWEIFNDNNSAHYYSGILLVSIRLTSLWGLSLSRVSTSKQWQGAA